MKNVYLIGMMGSGKTSSGKVLAEMLSVPFIDLDDRIVSKAGRSINEIFNLYGESYFRNMEHEMLAEVSKGSNEIIATGGGVVLNPISCALMKNSGLVIYLKTSIDVLWERTKTKKDRPLLQTADPKKTLVELFKMRAPLYEQNSSKSFLTDRKTPEEVAEEIYKDCFAQ